MLIQKTKKVENASLIRKVVGLMPGWTLAPIYRAVSKIGPIKRFVHKQISKIIPEKIKLGRFDFYLNQKDAIVSGSIAMQIYEPAETKFFIDKIEDNSVIVDIGANIGYYTLLAAEKARLVLSFEPEEVSFGYLKKNILENNLRNVSIHQLAISNKRGELNFYKNTYNCGDSRVYKFEDAKETQKVRSISLDDFLLENKVEKVDVIKMDIQGAEMLALQGMQKTLSKNNPWIFTEFFPKGIYKCGSNPVEFIKNLFSEGYSVWKINEKNKELKEIKDAQKFVDGFSGSSYCNLLCKKII